MMAIQSKRNDALPFTSPRVREEVGAQRRVRVALRESEPVESPPHPNPLRASSARLAPASAERGRSTALRGER
jgi:hypothetical protein